jgi:rubredoxin
MSLRNIDMANNYKKYMCVVCGFVYNEEEGLPDEGIAPGTRWKDIPNEWECPDCAANKADFELIEEV